MGQTFVDVEQECTTEGCEWEGSGKLGKCVKCINELHAKGWRITRGGTLVNKETGVKVTARGNVTITASYNPRMMALMAGEISVEDLDEEELARGMCRGENGQFPKRAPSMVPKAMYDKMTRELFSRAEETLKVSLVKATENLASIAADPNVDAGTRLKAATWMYERLMGKAPTEVKISAEKPFEHVLTKVARGPRPPVAPAADIG
jgi:hypothetical protein